MAESESLRENGQREKAIRLENAAMKIEIEVATMVAVPINEDRTWKIVDQFSEEIDFSDIEEAVKSAKELLKQWFTTMLLAP